MKTAAATAPARPKPALRAEAAPVDSGGPVEVPEGAPPVGVPAVAVVLSDSGIVMLLVGYTTVELAWPVPVGTGTYLVVVVQKVVLLAGAVG